MVLFALKKAQFRMNKGKISLKYCFTLWSLIIPVFLNGSESHSSSQISTLSHKRVVIIPRVRCSHLNAQAPEDATPEVKLSWQILPKISTILRTLMYHEQQGIDGAFFRFNHEDIGNTWANCHEVASESLESSLILDEGEDTSTQVQTFRRNKYFIHYKNTAIGRLINAGIKVYQLKKNRDGSTQNRKERNRLYWGREIMHHKFLLFKSNALSKGPLLVTGSYNGTRNADTYNWENIVILDEKKVIQNFKDELDRVQAAGPELLESTIQETSDSSDDDTLGATPQQVKEGFLYGKEYHLEPSIKGQKAGFTGPDNENYWSIPTLISSLLRREKINQIYGALELCNDPTIANAIGKSPDITGTLIVNEKGSKCGDLHAKGIQIRKAEKKATSNFASETMHNKFVILYGLENKAWLITSSGHPNLNANELSWEASIVITDLKTIALFKKEFDLLASDEHSKNVFPTRASSSSSSITNHKRKADAVN